MINQSAPSTSFKEWIVLKLLKPMGLTALRSIRDAINDLIRKLEQVSGGGRGRQRALTQGGETFSAPFSVGAAMTTTPPTSHEFVEDGVEGVTLTGEEFMFGFERDNSLYRVKFIPCNPLSWAGTRAAKLAKQYIAYKPVSLTLRYRPSCASTTTGNILISTRNSADNVPTGAIDMQRYFLAKNGACWTTAWAAGECTSHEPMLQKYYKLDLMDMPETGDWGFVVADSVNTLVGTLGLGMLSIEYKIKFLGKRNTNLGLEYSTLGRESLNIVNSTMAYNHRVGTILYLINNLDELDVGGFRMTCGDRLVVIKNTAGTSTFAPLDTRRGTTDLINTGGAIIFDGFEPADEY
jgi:hypothetical protein